jgi:predicted small lipoprotein YifL
MRKPLIALTIVALALSACGAKKPLSRPAGDPVPPTAAAVDVAPDSDALVTPDSQARPDRSDEILKRSQRRGDDRFDLPPTD